MKLLSQKINSADCNVYISVDCLFDWPLIFKTAFMNVNPQVVVVDTSFIKPLTEQHYLNWAVD